MEIDFDFSRARLLNDIARLISIIFETHNSEDGDTKNLDYIKKSFRIFQRIGAIAHLEDELEREQKCSKVELIAKKAAKENCNNASMIAGDTAQFRKLKGSMRKSNLTTNMAMEKVLPMLISSHCNDMHRDYCDGRKISSSYCKNFKKQGRLDVNVPNNENRHTFTWKEPIMEGSTNIAIRREMNQHTAHRLVARSA